MVFREDGHLSGEALEAMAGNEDRFDDLERLEIAEHLAFCDCCLQRYTLALEDGTLDPARLEQAAERLRELGCLQSDMDGSSVLLVEFRLRDTPGSVAAVLELIGWSSPGPSCRRTGPASPGS